MPLQQKNKKKDDLLIYIYLFFELFSQKNDF